MTMLKLVSAGLIFTAMLAVPATARENNAAAGRVANANAAAPGAPVVYKRGCVRAPDVGAFASDPWRKPPCKPTSRY
jgi:hypothetical protein